MPDKSQTGRRGTAVTTRPAMPPVDLIDRTTNDATTPADGDAAAVGAALNIPTPGTDPEAVGGGTTVPPADGEASAADGADGTPPAAAPNVNGIDLRRCEAKSEGGRQCVLAPHDDKTDHKFRSSTGESVRENSPVKAAAVPPLAFLLETPMEDVPDDAPPVETVIRSDAQKLIDADVLAAHAAWVEAGKPKDFNDSPRKRRLVLPEHVEGLRTLLLEAGKFHGVRVKVAPVKTHESGRKMLYFVVTDKPGSRKTATDKPAAQTAPVADGAADAPGNADIES